LLFYKQAFLSGVSVSVRPRPITAIFVISGTAGMSYRASEGIQALLAKLTRNSTWCGSLRFKWTKEAYFRNPISVHHCLLGLFSKSNHGSRRSIGNPRANFLASEGLTRDLAYGNVPALPCPVTVILVDKLTNEIGSDPISRRWNIPHRLPTLENDTTLP